MTFENKKVLVTGHAGLIGSVVVRMLEEQGAKVSGYDLTEGRDIMDLNLLIEHVKGKDVVIHLAAYSGVQHSQDLGYEAWRVNAWGTVNVLEACRYETDLQAVLIASTNHLYGHADHPTPETAAFRKMDTYTATKAAADFAAQSYADQYGVPTAILRNTNCYGPNDPHLDHIIPGTIQSILNGEPPVIRSDGRTWKGYLYVDDVADAYLRVANYVMRTNDYGQAFNVSSEESWSSQELVFAIIQAMGSDLKPIFENKPNDEADEKLDWRKINKLTGWKPTHSLTEGIRLTVAGFKGRVPA